MHIAPDLHLGYCTNIHRGEDWAQTFQSLQTYTRAVRERVCPRKPFGIGLRLSALAARELSEPAALVVFRRWLDGQNSYVFTINGFPYGKFHGTRVKEQVYAPDWTTSERVVFTKQLFEILAQLLPEGGEGSVSTLPGSFKEFITTPEQVKVMRANLWECIDYIAELSRRTGRRLHLGLEPEPLCYLETTQEVVAFFEQMRTERPGDEHLHKHLGVNYDTCHMAVEFEEPAEAVQRLVRNGVKLSKVHLSSALKVRPGAEVRKALTRFLDDVYLHQVVERRVDGTLRRFRDLDLALQESSDRGPEGVEWRIHFHVPLHSRPDALFDNTSEHIEGLLNQLHTHPDLCRHLEMETYTWEVLPEGLKNRDVVEQLVCEYDWTLKRLAEHGNIRAS